MLTEQFLSFLPGTVHKGEGGRGVIGLSGRCRFPWRGRPPPPAPLGFAHSVEPRAGGGVHGLKFPPA